MTVDWWLFKTSATPVLSYNAILGPSRAQRLIASYTAGRLSSTSSANGKAVRLANHSALLYTGRPLGRGGVGGLGYGQTCNTCIKFESLLLARSVAIYKVVQTTPSY